MTEVIVGFLLTATAASLGFTVNKLFAVSSLVSRIDERTQGHERRLVDLEEVA